MLSKKKTKNENIFRDTEFEKIRKQIRYSINYLTRFKILHSCFSRSQDIHEFEKLEFIGDSILRMKVTQFLANTKSFMTPFLLGRYRVRCESNFLLSYVYDFLLLSEFSSEFGSSQSKSKDEQVVMKRKGDVIECILGELTEYSENGSDYQHKKVVKTLINQLIGLIVYIGEIEYYWCLFGDCAVCGKKNVEEKKTESNTEKTKNVETKKPIKNSTIDKNKNEKLKKTEKRDKSKTDLKKYMKNGLLFINEKIV